MDSLAESLEMFLPTVSSIIFPWVTLCTIVLLIVVGIAKAYRWIKRNAVG